MLGRSYFALLLLGLLWRFVEGGWGRGVEGIGGYRRDRGVEYGEGMEGGRVGRRAFIDGGGWGSRDRGVV